MNKECLNPNCNNLFRNKRNKKYCCLNCSRKTYYITNKKIIIERARKWELEYPERRKKIVKKAFDNFYYNKRNQFNKLMMKGYHRHKDRWYARTTANSIIKGTHNFSKMVLPDSFYQCQKCYTTDKLWLKFMIYPNKVKDIRKAIIDDKIYYLCRSCHLKVKG